MSAMTVFHRSIAATFMTVAIASIAPITEAGAVPRRVQIGPEIGLFSMYNGFLPYSQAGFKNDDFGYRYLRDGYFTYDWGDDLSPKKWTQN